MIPGEPDIESIMNPAVTLIDLVTFISGSISFWFGLVFYTFLSDKLPITSLLRRLQYILIMILPHNSVADIDVTNNLKERHILKDKLYKWFKQKSSAYDLRKEVMSAFITESNYK